MKAHAAVATKPWHVEFQEVEAPEPEPEDVVIRVTHSWISNGTEGSFVRGERIAGDTPISESDPSPFPHVPGYQKVGVVEEVGSEVSDVQVGETVFATVSHVSGMFYSFGGHVSPAVTHRSQVWKLPSTIDPVAVSGLVLTQVGYNVGVRPALEAGEAAVVLGDGMVGHWSAQTLKHRGARVMLLGRHDERLARFETSTEDRIVNVAKDDPLMAIRAWAPEGIQVVADTVGSIAAVESLYPVMRHNSHIASAGFYGPKGLIDLKKMRAREITLHTPAGWTQERMDATLKLVEEGALKTKHLITHHFPVSKAGEAFDLILSRREPRTRESEVLGVLLDWE